MNNYCKKKTIVVSRNWSQTAKLHQSHCTVTTVLYGSRPYLSTRPSLFSTARHNTLRYLNTVKIALVRIGRTSLAPTQTHRLHAQGDTLAQSHGHF